MSEGPLFHWLGFPSASVTLSETVLRPALFILPCFSDCNDGGRCYLDDLSFAFGVISVPFWSW